MSSAKSPAAESTPAPSRFAKLGKLAGPVLRAAKWSAEKPLQAGLAVILASLVIVPAGVAWMSIPEPPQQPPLVLTFAMALEALDAGDLARARRIAEAVERRGGLKKNEKGGPAFIRGWIAAQEANELLGADADRRRADAVLELQASAELGFPPGRSADALYALGRARFLIGQATSVLETLEQALEANPDRADELHEYLAESLLRQTPPRWDEAQAHNRAFLANESLTDEDRSRGAIRDFEIELAKGNLTACQATLAELAESTPAPVLAMLQGRLLTRTAGAQFPEGRPTEVDPTDKTKADLYRQAIEKFQAAIVRDREEYDVSPAATYMIGVCRRNLGEVRAAAEQFARVHDRHFDRPEGRLGAFQAGDSWRRLGRDELAMEAFRAAAFETTKAEDFENRWVGLVELRDRVIDAYRDFMERERFETAVELTGLLGALLGTDRAKSLSADARAKWGQALLAESEGLEHEAAKAKQAEARGKFRDAGREYRELATLRYLSHEFPTDLWNAAENYLAGHDYERAETTFGEYLEAENQRRQSQALLGLAEAKLALGRPEECLTTALEIVDLYPREQATPAARLLASRALFELGRLEEAAVSLQANLTGETLAPSSSEWRESLFALGRTLLAANRFPEAIESLEEALARYPNSPQALEARYLTAEAYRQSAELARRESEAEVTREGRDARVKENDRYLQAAWDHYDQVLAVMLAKQQRTRLDPMESLLMRNCYFAKGAASYGMRRYQDAIAAYAAALNRYQEEPVVLDAYFQIAACYRRLHKRQEALGALAQAKVALGRMNDNSQFQRTTNFSRDEWSRLLDSMEKF